MRWRRPIGAAVAAAVVSTVVLLTVSSPSHAQEEPDLRRSSVLVVDPTLLYDDARPTSPFEPARPALKPRLHLGTVSARLTDGRPFAGLAGRHVTFTTSTRPLGDLGGPPIICADVVTDDRGVATCSFSAYPATLLLILLNGVEASFAGDEQYLPSTGSTRQLTLLGV